MAVKDFKCLEDLPNYVLKEEEEYMNNQQILHFKNKLMSWKEIIQNEIQSTVHAMKATKGSRTDTLDRASQEHSISLELRTRDREYKLIKKIDEALMRIEFGDYGYCRVTGDEIGIERLDARPTCDLCIQVKNQLEKKERNFS